MSHLILFIRKPRFYSSDVDRVNKSIFQWGPVENKYYLSILGIINGFLPKFFNRVLVVRDDELTIVKKWW